MELRREEQRGRQRARINWLKLGDKNSNFFHNVANGRRSRNQINEIILGGIKISDPCLVKEGIREFFKDYFSNVNWSRPKVRGLGLKRLSVSEKGKL